MTNLYKQLFTVIFVSISSLPGTLMADSNSANGASPSTSARLDFRVTIPGVLRFQVGTAGLGNIDIIDFDPPVATLGNGTDTPGTGGDGTAGAGAVTVDLFSNAGQVTITEENNGSGNGLNNGTAGENIPYSEIITTSGDPTNFAAPTLSNSTKNTSTPSPTSGNNKVTNRSTTWSYAYDNSTDYPAGTYGTQANGGRVTYTAATP